MFALLCINAVVIDPKNVMLKTADKELCLCMPDYHCVRKFIVVKFTVYTYGQLLCIDIVFQIYSFSDIVFKVFVWACPSCSRANFMLFVNGDGKTVPNLFFIPPLGYHSIFSHDQSISSAAFFINTSWF